MTTTLTASSTRVRGVLGRVSMYRLVVLLLAATRGDVGLPAGLLGALDLWSRPRIRRRLRSPIGSWTLTSGVLRVSAA